MTVYPRACGGTGDRKYGRIIIGVYPRACGGTSPATWLVGSIPARAGEPSSYAAISDCIRSIPARAGEPKPRSNTLATRTVYPRACGGTGAQVVPLRVRPIGSIPARAGEPHRSRLIACRVYPRACGGTHLWPTRCRAAWVYPRACGGTAMVFARVFGWVYPRACGGTSHPLTLTGLSGSIPARAGEPPVCRCANYNDMWVYPRACGGTSPECAAGLSRLVSKFRRVYPRACGGTIPVSAVVQSVYPRACGGTVHPIARHRIRVYPRACGGTDTRMRRHSAQRGSIPARAGEPQPPVAAAQPGYVACRSIPARAGEPPFVAQTLSPRVGGVPTGSIPARAGEPLGKLIVSICHHSPRECD